jgi:hypothetical protein
LKLSGSRCDTSQGECVAGTPSIDGSDNRDGSPGIDANKPQSDAPFDGMSADDTGDGTLADAPIDTAPETEAGPTATEPDWDKVLAYLQGLYDPSQQLLKRAPGSSEYWATNDNSLAVRALADLPNPDPTKSQAIATRLGNLHTCNCSDTFGHSAKYNHLIDAIVDPAGQIPDPPTSACYGEPTNTGTTATSSCNAGFDSGAIACSLLTLQTEDHPTYSWGPDLCHTQSCSPTKYTGYADQGVGAGIADLLALEILSHRHAGKNDVLSLWGVLAGKWDGTGMRDSFTQSGAMYSTYKLALFKLVTRVLGQALPAGVDQKLAQAQGPNGGIRTSYALDGTFSLDQSGNVETTSYVVIAYLTPISSL